MRQQRPASPPPTEPLEPLPLDAAGPPLNDVQVFDRDDRLYGLDELLQATCQREWRRASGRLDKVSPEVAGLVGDREAGAHFSSKTALHIAAFRPSVSDVDYQRFLELLVVKARWGPSDPAPHSSTQLLATRGGMLRKAVVAGGTSEGLIPGHPQARRALNWRDSRCGTPLLIAARIANHVAARALIEAF